MLRTLDSSLLMGHYAGDVRTEQGLEGLYVHQAVSSRLHFDYFQAADCRRCRIGAVGAVGDYHLSSGGIPTCHVVLAHQHESCEFAVGTGARQEGEVLHAGNRRQGRIKPVNHLLRALHSICRLQRMQAGKQWMRGNFFVDLGVIFHGAGSQRIESRIYAKVHLAQISIMTHYVNFADFRQI